MWGLLAWIVLGLIAGAIAKAIPGHQGGGIVAIVLGIGCISRRLAGWYLLPGAGYYCCSDFDLQYYILQFLVRSSSCLCGLVTRGRVRNIEILRCIYYYSQMLLWGGIIYFKLVF